MKKGVVAAVLLLVALALAVLAGCNRDSRAHRAEAQVDSLHRVMARQDTMIHNVFSELDRIVTNLQAIKVRENIIAVTVAESDMQHLAVNRISADIAAIDSLLADNRRVIGTLRGSVEELRAAKIRVGTLEALLDQLTAQVDTDDTQTDELRRQLEERNLQVRTLKGAVAGLTHRGEVLESEVRAASELLNIAYYIIDSQRALLRDNVVTKSGFIGRTLKVNENRSLDSFTRVDIRSFDHVQIHGHDPMMVSTHPDTSYKFVTDDAGVMWLNILDPEAFWKYTKVLVVAYK